MVERTNAYFESIMQLVEPCFSFLFQNLDYSPTDWVGECIVYSRQVVIGLLLHWRLSLSRDCAMCLRLPAGIFMMKLSRRRRGFPSCRTRGSRLPMIRDVFC